MEQAMKIGIVLNYQRHDSTYAAIKTAELVRDLGYTVSLFDKSPKATKPRLHDFWDSFVITNKEQNFEEWYADCPVLIWYTYPTYRELKGTRKQGINSICVATWDSVDSEVATCLKSCDLVVCPSKSQVSYFSSYWRLKDLEFIPVDCNWPITKNDRPDRGYFKVVVACPGYQIKRIDHTKLFEALYTVMQLCPGIEFVFLFSGKVASQIKINVTKYEKSLENGSKLTCIDDPTGWAEGPIIYTDCDAVLWPVQLESFGYVALEALTMGTPVIAYNFLPMNEIVSDQVNGLLIPCDSKETDLGVSYAVHNEDGLVKTVTKLVNDPALYSKIKGTVHKGLEERSKKAKSMWSETLDRLTKDSKGN